MVRKMKTPRLLAIGALLLALTVSATQSEAGVNVSVNLPVLTFAAQPELVVIPGTYVYMVPDIEADVLFYQGYWWRPYEGRWYRSRDYRRGWSYVDSRRIPGGLRSLPSDYRHRLSPGHERVPHGDVLKNWKKWEKEKHWDKRGEQGRGEHGGEQGRGGHGEQDRGGHGEQDRSGHGEQGHGGR